MFKKLINPMLILVILVSWGWYFKLYAESPLFVETTGTVLRFDEVRTRTPGGSGKVSREKISYTYQVEYEALGVNHTVSMSLNGFAEPVAVGTEVRVFFNGEDPTHARHGSPRPDWIWVALLTLFLGFFMLNRFYMSS